MGDVGYGQSVVDATDAAGLLETWGATVEAAPRDLTSFLAMGRARAGQRAVAQILAVVNNDDPDVILDRLQPLAKVATLLDHAAQVVPHAEIMDAPPGAHNGQGEPVARSGLVEHITPSVAAAAARMIDSGAVFFFQIRSVGGAVADVDPQATAYAHRSANCAISVF